MPRNKPGAAISHSAKSDHPLTVNETSASVSSLVGVLTSGKNINQGIPTGKKARIFREMAQHARQKGVDLFFFYLDDVNWKHRTIKGLALSGQKNWIMRTYPFPDIVYNRILYRNIEKTDNTRRSLKRFEMEKDVELFNTRFLEKWEVYKAFKRGGLADDLLPETDLFSKRTLQLYCRKYKDVFLKPRNGSKGKGIIKISRGTDDKGFYYTRAENAKHDKSRYCGGLETLYRELKAAGVLDERYLLQQGIDLATYQGCIFDIRSQVQKDGNGQWVFTGAGARVAARNSFVTHIPNGGHLADLHEVLAEVFDPGTYNIKSFIQKLDETTVAAGQILDSQLGINLAILSLDVAVEPDGRMWILEINSKPASFDEDAIRFRHFDYLMDYARYIGYKKYMRIDD